MNAMKMKLKKTLIFVSLLVSNLASAGIDFVTIPVRYLSRDGKVATVELHGKKLKISTNQIENVEKQRTGTLVKARLSPEEIGLASANQ